MSESDFGRAPLTRGRIMAGSEMAPAEPPQAHEDPLTDPPGNGPRGAAEEDAYRRHYLRSDTLPAATLVGLIGLGSLLIFFKNDRQLFAPGPELYRLLVVRVIELGVSIGVVAVLVRSKSPRHHDRAIVVALTMATLTNLYVVSTRPPEFIGHGSLTAFAITLIYFAMPGPLLARIVVALAMSVSTFVFALRTPVPVIGLNTMLLTHALTHLVGIPMAARLEGLRRRRFSAEVKARDALTELAKKARDLEIAKERAEALARVKSDFLATMSHEFRTPMNAVIGLSELLVDSPLAPDQRDLVCTIRDSAGALLYLLNDILDLAKIDAGRMSIESASFDVRALALRALDVVRHQAAAKGLTVDLAIDESVPVAVLGDVGRLRQALVNLLSNSVKFTEKGAIALRISSTKSSQDAPEHDLRFRVEDTGVGISAETLERLFAPFEQGDASATRHHGGTGLGLSITKRIVELMGGTVSVESRVGHGSTFEFVLRAPEAEPPPVLPGAGGARIAEDLPLRILVVEDNVVNQRVAVATLGRLGYLADVAENGRDALAIMERRAYDVVFMDLRMPEMDGLETTRRALAAHAGRRCPRIVAMTASAFEEDRVACRVAGMVDFVSKPIQLHDLRDALLRVERPTSRAPSAPKLRVTLSQEPLDRLRELGALAEPGFFADLCRQFIIDSRERLGRLDASMTAGDGPTVELEAHTLKSSSASLGAMHLAELCAALEVAARGGALGGELLPPLQREFEQVAAALETESLRAN